MATKKPPYSAKAKIWLPTMTGEVEGKLLGCVIEMFRYLPAPDRMMALNKMQAAHTELTAREEERAKNDQ
ncbi:hypothetical protein OVA10_15815 [Lelliottia sp. SL45]|uniref:hypothetical protein n=1 Tax=Lelliottia sp. SL45 TaxID=2994665 RepID=UPI0022749BCC|nr:hypothetical protein [Lelliottia sp. SL45]MCY1699512.1 hypothetical protein [Lelliottia sp. SL45]